MRSGCHRRDPCSTARRHGRQAGLGEEYFDYMPSSFTTGSLAGRRVNCLSAEQQRQFRTGYELRPQDLHDLAELDAAQEVSRISVDDPDEDQFHAGIETGFLT